MAELHDHSAREHALLSASSSSRWLACPPSAVAAEAYPNQDTEFIREGTLAHEVAEAIAAGREYAEMPSESTITKEMVDCAENYRDYIQGQIQSPDAVVLLEQRVDYSTWAPGGFGTADCIIVQDGRLTVIDYKYGQGVPVDAVGNTQMRLYALGAYDLLSDVYEISQVDMHLFQPRLDNVSVDTLSTQELLDWAETVVRPAAALASKGGGALAAGAQCRFCPHAGRCPELTKVCTEIVQTHQLTASVPVLAPFEVAEVLRMEPLISLWLKRVKDQALSTLMDGGQIPGYKVVAGKQGNRKWSDELEVSRTLQANGYDLETITETKLLSPAAMDRAIGKKHTAELLAALIDRSPGAPTVVPDTDKRPPLDRLAEAKEDFA